MKYEIRLAVLFIEQLRTKEQREGHFCKRGALPLSSYSTCNSTPFLSLSLLCIFFFLLHHRAQRPSSQNPQFSISPARKSQDFASPSSNQPFDVKSGQNRRQASVISVELGYDSSSRREPKFSHAIPFLIALNPL